MAEMQFIGKQSLGDALPLPIGAALSAQAALELQLPSLSATASAAVQINPPVLATDLIQNLLNLIAAIKALIASGVTLVPPSINAQLGVDLNLDLGSIQASLELQLELIYALAPTCYAWYYNGACVDFSGSVAEVLGTGLPDVGEPGQDIAALVLVCSEGTAIDALKKLAGL